MASTNFKLFDENKANMMSDTEYNINSQRLNGVQAGIASSRLQNKTLYQTSLVAYSLAQIMMQNGFDAKDSAAVSAFVSNMSNSLLQKVLDKATSTEAQNGINNTKWMTPALTKAAIDILAAKSQNILSDSTKTLFGLGTNAVPNDVLAELGKYKQYWWRRRRHVDSSHYVGNVTTVSWGATQFRITYKEKRTIYYSDSYTVDPTTGAISLDNQQSVTCSDDGSFYAENPESLLLGKWCLNLNEKPSEVVYIPVNADIRTSSDSSDKITVYLYKIGNYRKVDATFVESTEIGDWVYVQSSDRSTYPDSGVSNGYEYEYLGIPLDNSVIVPKVETGSYEGTGTYGSRNKTSITFSFTPKWLMIYNKTFAGYAFWNDLMTSSMYTHINYTDGRSATFSFVDFTLSWYADNAPSQLNVEGATYYYIAIGL